MDVGTFLGKFAEILETPSSEITTETALESISSWDSVNVLSYMAFVDQEFGREVKPDDIAEAKTVEDLYRLAMGQPIAAV